MNRLVLTATALLSLSVVGSANAADMGVPPMPTKAPIMAPVYNWNGFYFGGNVGGGTGHTDYNSYLSSGALDFTGTTTRAALWAVARSALIT